MAGQACLYVPSVYTVRMVSACNIYRERLCWHPYRWKTKHKLGTGWGGYIHSCCVQREGQWWDSSGWWVAGFYTIQTQQYQFSIQFTTTKPHCCSPPAADRKSSQALRFLSSQRGDGGDRRAGREILHWSGLQHPAGWCGWEWFPVWLTSSQMYFIKNWFLSFV